MHKIYLATVFGHQTMSSPGLAPEKAETSKGAVELVSRPQHRERNTESIRVSLRWEDLHSERPGSQIWRAECGRGRNSAESSRDLLRGLTPLLSSLWLRNELRRLGKKHQRTVSPTIPRISTVPHQPGWRELVTYRHLLESSEGSHQSSGAKLALGERLLQTCTKKAYEQALKKPS